MGCKKRKTSENDMHLQKCLTFGVHIRRGLSFCLVYQKVQ